MALHEIYGFRNIVINSAHGDTGPRKDRDVTSAARVRNATSDGKCDGCVRRSGKTLELASETKPRASSMVSRWKTIKMFVAGVH